MAVTTQSDRAGTLVELLGEQCGIYRQLNELAGRQSELVEGGDAEALLALLARRQSLIDQLTQINGRLEPYRDQWPSLWRELDESTRQRVTSLIDEVQRLLDEIVAQDERDRATLAAQRDRMADDMQRLGRGAAMNRAYGQAGPGATHPRYTDQEG